MAGQQTQIEVAGLEKRISELQKNLAFVGQGSSDSSDLFRIIHQPGWTTVAQVQLAANVLDTMNQQASAMRGLQGVLETHVKESGGR